MEFDPQDRKVVELLTKLKGASESYPSQMLAARRQAFLNTMAGAGLSVGTGSALNGTSKGGGGSGAASLSIGKVLEVALIVAIVAEAGALAYFYRDRVADVFRSTSEPSHVQEISPPVATFSFPDLEISEIPSSAVPTGTAPEMATSTSTQIPDVADDPTSDSNVDVSSTDPMSGANVNSDSTPVPNVNNDNNGNPGNNGNNGNNSNNGNHYGQTPRPERTKDNHDNQRPNDNHGNGNNQ